MLGRNATQTSLLRDRQEEVDAAMGGGRWAVGAGSDPCTICDAGYNPIVWGDALLYLEGAHGLLLLLRYSYLCSGQKLVCKLISQGRLTTIPWYQMLVFSLQIAHLEKRLELSQPPSQLPRGQGGSGQGRAKGKMAWTGILKL